MIPLSVNDSPLLKVTLNLAVLFLMNVTLVAGETVDVQIRAKEEDPGTNTKFEMAGSAERDKL